MRATYLQTSALGMALLLLGAINARGLPPGALAPRRLALSTGHCDCWSGVVYRFENKVAKMGPRIFEQTRCLDGDDATFG